MGNDDEQSVERCQCGQEQYPGLWSVGDDASDELQRDGGDDANQQKQ